jgi:hypothetical protein
VIVSARSRSVQNAVAKQFVSSNKHSRRKIALK